MADEGFKVQVSYKFGAHDEHMINVRGDSTDEVEGLIGDLSVQVVTDFGALLRAGAVATPLTQPAATQSPAAAQLAAPPVAAPAAVQSCIHGPRTRRTGVSARGAWVAHFCPLPKSHPEQCAGVFE